MPCRIYPPDAPREPMDVTIQAYDGFGMARYVGAVTFRAHNAPEAAYLHLLVKVDDFAQEGARGQEWYERLCSVLREPLDWSNEPRIQTGERGDDSHSPEGWKPHPTNQAAFERKTVQPPPEPSESKRFPLADSDRKTITGGKAGGGKTLKTAEHVTAALAAGHAVVYAKPMTKDDILPPKTASPKKLALPVSKPAPSPPSTKPFVLQGKKKT